MGAVAVFLCPGQGSQAVGMGAIWRNTSSAAARVFAEADAVLGPLAGAGARTLSQVCTDGPAEVLNRTDISQPALFACGVACAAALTESRHLEAPAIASGLSLGEYTALHLAGAFSFADGLRLVAARGALMQAAAESSRGGMVALIGADEEKTNSLCATVCSRIGGTNCVLVPANFNAPGQIVVSGSSEACDMASSVAAEMGLRAARLAVAGAFHSPLMAPAAAGMREVLDRTGFSPLRCSVWSNVTAKPHHSTDVALLKDLLVKQITSPVRWSQSCTDMIAAQASQQGDKSAWMELAPGAVLKGLMRRIDRTCEVTSHDVPTE